MSASLFLFLDAEGKANVDPAKIRNCLRNLRGVSNFREDADTALDDVLFECFFTFNQDATTIVIPKGQLAFISIWGTGEASLQAALEIQKGYDAPLYIAVSESPSTVVNLSSVSTLADLKHCLRL